MNGTSDILLNGLSLIYNDLDIAQDMASLSWSATRSCSNLFELQGYTLENITTGNLEIIQPDVVIRINNSNTAVIPSANFSTSSGDVLYYRLVALFDNFTLCSHQETRTTFYRFDGRPIFEIARAEI
jgi:hypothetical protein